MRWHIVKNFTFQFSGEIYKAFINVHSISSLGLGQFAKFFAYGKLVDVTSNKQVDIFSCIIER